MPTEIGDVLRRLYPSTSSDENEEEDDTFESPNLVLSNSDLTANTTNTSLSIEDFQTERYEMTFRRESIENISHYLPTVTTTTDVSMDTTITENPAPCIVQQTIENADIMEFGEPTNDKVIEYVANDVVAGNRSALTFAVRMVKENLNDEKVDGIEKRRLREACEYACYKEMDAI